MRDAGDKVGRLASAKESIEIVMGSYPCQPSGKSPLPTLCITLGIQGLACRVLSAINLTRITIVIDYLS